MVISNNNLQLSYNDIFEKSQFLKETVQEMDIIGESKNLLKNIVQIIMIDNKIKLFIMNINKKSEKEEIEEKSQPCIYFLILMFCRNESLLGKIFLMSEYIENKQIYKEEKNIFENLKVN